MIRRHHPFCFSMIWKNIGRQRSIAACSFISKQVLFFVCCIFTTLPSSGQILSRKYDFLPFDKRASFGKFPANWSFADSVAIHPDRISPLRVFPGNKVLVGKPGEATTLSVNAKNFKLFIAYTLTSKASVKISLPGGGTIILTEGTPSEASQINGYSGQTPIQDAGKMAGLSQTIEIDYESDIPNLRGRTRLNEIKINGVVVQQGQYLTQTPFAPLSLQVTQGTAVIKAIGVQQFEYKKPVSIANLTYKIYDDAWNSRQTEVLSNSGQSPELSVEVAGGKKSFHLVYEGDLIIDENGDYDFTTVYTGAYCQLSIEGNEVLDSDQSTSQETHLTNVRLDKGTHRFKLWYSKTPWMPAALGLRVGKSGVREYDLHARSSLPEPPVKPFVIVKPQADKAEMVRSFIQLSSENHKRTHCLSVGAPTGRHYSVDLNRGALLQVWSGEFANVTEMWYERAQPQLLSTLGLTEPLSPRSSFVRLTDQSAPWVDSSSVNFQNYSINEQGYPTFQYLLGPSVIKDAISTHKKGITRTITPDRNPSANNFVLLAEGRLISLIEKGLYVVDGRYYIKTSGGKTPFVRNSKGKTELILPVATPVSYSILW